MAMQATNQARVRVTERLLTLVLAAAWIVHAGSGSAAALTLVWQKPSGGSWPATHYWYDSGADVYQIPTSSDDAIIDNGGNAAVRNQDCNAYNLYVGNTSSGSGTVAWRAGNTRDLHVYNDFFVGNNGTGRVYMYDGQADGKTLDVDNSLYVGNDGSSRGYFTHEAGTVNVGNRLYVGRGSGAYSIIVGRHGDGHVIQSGGNVYGPTTSQGIYLGFDDDATGEWQLSGTGQVNSGQFLHVGRHGQGIFTQTGGSVTVPSYAALGYSSDGEGTYEISGGDLDVDGMLYVGNSGTGLFKIIGDDATIEADGYSQNAGSTLELDINGISPINVDGSVTLAGTLDVEFLAPPSYEEQFAIIINNSDDLITGTFAGLAEGDTFYVPGSGIPLTISYLADFDGSGGSPGNDVVLSTGVPEPSTVLLLCLGVLGLVFARGRRIRQIF